MLFIMLLGLSFGHSGRTDSSGGHNGPGGYHFHSGSYKPNHSKSYKYPERVKEICGYTEVYTNEALSRCIKKIEKRRHM